MDTHVLVLLFIIVALNLVALWSMERRLSRVEDEQRAMSKGLQRAWLAINEVRDVEDVRVIDRRADACFICGHDGYIEDEPCFNCQPQEGE